MDFLLFIMSAVVETVHGIALCKRVGVVSRVPDVRVHHSAIPHLVFYFYTGKTGLNGSINC